MNEGHRVALFCLVWLLFFFSLIIAKVPYSILFILDLCLMGQKDMFAFPFSGFEHSNPVFECSCSYCEKDSWLFQGSCSRAIWPAPVFSAKSISAIQIPVLPPVRKWEAVPLWEHAVQWREGCAQAPRHCTASPLVGTPQWFTAPSFSYHDNTACLLSDAPGWMPFFMNSFLEMCPGEQVKSVVLYRARGNMGTLR